MRFSSSANAFPPFPPSPPLPAAAAAALTPSASHALLYASLATPTPRFSSLSRRSRSASCFDALAALAS